MSLAISSSSFVVRFSCCVFVADSSSRRVLHTNIRTHVYVVLFYGEYLVTRNSASSFFLAFSVFWRDLISVSSLMFRSSFSASSLFRIRSASPRDLLSSSSSTIDYVREGRREVRGVHTLEVLDVLLEGLADFVHLEGEFSFSLNLALHLFELHILTSLEVLRLLQLLLDLINLVFELLNINF